MEPLGNPHTRYGRFLAAYIEAIYFTETGDHEQPPASEPLTIAERAVILADCEKFYVQHSHDFRDREASAGHDFWLTRNGHGAGFWDGDWPEDIGNRLTDASETFGPCEGILLR